MTVIEEPHVDLAASPAPRAPRVSPAPFSSSYDTARRSYGVATALLLAWALVGIELDKTPLESVKVTLKSPQAAPYVFIAAVLYFAFRFTVEWYQSDHGRRALQASRIDFGVAHALGGLAIAVFIGQKLLHTQLADWISAHGIQIGYVMLGITAGWPLDVANWSGYSRHTTRIVVATILGAAGVFAITYGPLPLWMGTFLFVAGALIAMFWSLISLMLAGVAALFRMDG